MKSNTIFSPRNPSEPLALRAVPSFFPYIQRQKGTAMPFALDVTSEVPPHLTLFRVPPPQKSPSRREIQSRLGEPTP
jgi:hypothetical protein